MSITPEIAEAVDYLRTWARMVHADSTALEVDIQAAKAIDVLDNADFFTSIDDAREEGEGLEPGSQNDVRADFINVYARTRNIQLDYAEGLMRHVEHCAVTNARDTAEGPALDSGEWGDTTRADMARHQQG